MSEGKPHLGIVIAGHVDVWKTFDYNTEILMFDGSSKLAGEIRGNNILMENDSTPRIVQSTHQVYSYGYKIGNNSGDYIINNAHILSLVLTNMELSWWDNNRKRWKIRWVENSWAYFCT